MDPFSALALFGAAAVAVSVAKRRQLGRMDGPRQKDVAWPILMRIGEVAAGELVRVAGRIVMPESPPLVAPLTGRPCVAYSVVVERTDSSEAQSRVLELSDVMPFVVRDEAGATAMVRPGRDSILYNYDAVGTQSFWHDGPSDLRDFLVRHGLPVDGLIAPIPYRWHEGVLEPGEEVGVVGVARRELDPAATGLIGYREQPTRLVFTAQTGTVPTIVDGPARWHLR